MLAPINVQDVWGFWCQKRVSQAGVTASHTLQWRHNEHDGVSNYQPHHCLLNLLFGRRSKKTSKLRVTGLCVGNSPGTGEFPAQMARNAENVSIWWRHNEYFVRYDSFFLCLPEIPVSAWRQSSHLCTHFASDVFIHWKICHVAYLIVTGGTGGGHYDNLRCHQWRWNILSGGIELPGVIDLLKSNSDISWIGCCLFYQLDPNPTDT